ncbi:hypothetical protein H0266_02390 [Halobacillus locisalis]|uniref:Uncharacterized protein n=1 Tax=Halobacillus locisalis TaxID=220753 RepID=A0A838CPH1_9BACI|nr:hypothetical protein [Halobacillus locisalis]MBA2173739.1 hypothetical protein [Halobacillus locisalis]
MVKLRTFPAKEHTQISLIFLIIGLCMLVGLSINFFLEGAVDSLLTIAVCGLTLYTGMYHIVQAKKKRKHLRRFYETRAKEA